MSVFEETPLYAENDILIP